MTTENKKESLPYKMGNAGDLIKHGALALFVQWWCENNPAKEFRFADPFGGMSGEREINPVIKQRLETLSSEEPFVAGCLWDGKSYRNSGHIVCSAVRECGKNPQVWTSDSSPEKRKQLAASGLSLLDDKYSNYDSKDGYSILPHAGDFDLVLLDPFGDLLRKDISQFQKIQESVRRNCKTTVMVFVLDMQPYKMPCVSPGICHKHEHYLEEREKFRDMAFSLRCRKAIPRKKDKTYDVEILLISKMFADGGGDKLRARLEQFKDAAQKTLKVSADDLTIWPE